MTQGNDQDVLIRLGETNLTVRDPAEDIRGWTVTDRHGEDLGHVSDLLLDARERRVHFLQVGAGGFLGMGERHFLVPVEAIVGLADRRVHLGQTREHVAGSPAYDPTLTVPRGRDFYAPYYGYYGYDPFWGVGYTYPGFPPM